MDYAALASEITNDPAGVGYAGRDDAAIADLLNQPNESIRVERDVIDTYEIVEVTVPSEWAALSAAEKQRYQTIVSCGRVNVRSTNTRLALAAMFGADTATRTALVALQTRAGSRAEQLGLVYVHHLDVAQALRG